MVVRSYKLIRSTLADSDLAAIRGYTVRNHGTIAAKAYSALLRQAFKDVREDPVRPGSKERPEIGPGVRSYHISLSRGRAESRIKAPRHFLLYYLPSEDTVVLSRVLRDSRDLARHMPDDHLKQAAGDEA